jgi:hypothetical protein
MTNRNLYAVIPSGTRPQDLAMLLHNLVHFSDVRVVVVDTGYDRFVVKHPRIEFIHDRGPINIQRWWNVGLKWVYACQGNSAPGDEFTVAVLNDDLRVPPRFVERLDEALNVTFPGAAAACPGGRGGGHLVNYLHAAPRMLGYAFALRGSLKLEADERFGWWYGDNDIDWRARELGGVVHVGGDWSQFVHLHPNETTVGELAEQAGRDRETFIQKWGIAPW